MSDKKEILKSRWYLILVQGTHLEVVGGGFDNKGEAQTHLRGLESHKNLHVVEGSELIEQRDEIGTIIQDKRS